MKKSIILTLCAAMILSVAACGNKTAQTESTETETELKIEPIHAVTYCQACGKTNPTIPQGKICPHCGSGNTFLITGNEYNIKEIEAC